MAGDADIKKIQDLRTIEMFGDQEKFLQKHYDQLARALQQSVDEIVLFLDGDLPGSKRLIRDIRERAARGVGFGSWTDQRLLKVVEEIDAWAQDIQKVTGKSINTSSVEMAKDVYRKYPDVFSLDGEIPDVSAVRLTNAQLTALVSQPIGGRSLNRWLENIFKTSVKADLRNELLVAAARGESIPKITRRIKSKYPWLSQRQIDRINSQARRRGLTGQQLTNWVKNKQAKLIKNNATTLARTHMQEVANNAMDSVFQQNEDIIRGFEWNATLEPGYSRTGRGTCLRCAALDGTMYRKDESRPDIPLHPNCRCIYTPVLKTWKELGVDADEIVRKNRPYAIRETDAEQAHGFGKSIGAGGRKTRGPAGNEPTATEYRKWFDRRNATFQVNVAGPSRAQWIRDNNRRTLRGLVHKDTGELKTLEELPGKTKKVTRVDYINKYGTDAEIQSLQTT